ncbi:hypothetical protein Hanom_Chr06g00572981 [Helianthus anomalus]
MITRPKPPTTHLDHTKISTRIHIPGPGPILPIMGPTRKHDTRPKPPTTHLDHTKKSTRIHMPGPGPILPIVGPTTKHDNPSQAAYNPFGPQRAHT